MSAIETIAQLLAKQLGGEGANVAKLLPALQNLLPTDGGELDIGSLVKSFTSSGDLMGMAASWLGNGANNSISGSQIADALGQDKVSQFAKQVGVDSTSVADALSNVIPQFIDGSSEGGSLLDGAAGSLVKGALKNLF